MATRSRENHDKAVRTESMLKAAETAGVGSDEYAAATADLDCASRIRSDCRRMVALLEELYDSHDEKFARDIGNMIEYWRPVFSDDELQSIRVELSSQEKLQSLGHRKFDDTRQLKDLPWWPFE